ncbi:alpha/beta fold hydrolase [Actinoplanes sp. NPDC051346]|uniref:alpha/beta fold hydrolase n=1 Tax=Actinoplanes sp. NPDC051346 TaxID=3155048 RepID=UPI003412F84A
MAFALGATDREAHVRGITLAYDDSAPEATGRDDRPVLLCLHAIGHGARDFAGLRAALAGQWRIVAPDWPGQGNSGPDREPPTATRYADLALGLLDTLGVARAAVLGNSIGGAAALRLAALHPDRVTGLVLIDGAGLAPIGPRERLAIHAFVALFRAGQRRRRWYRWAFAAYYRQLLRNPAAATHRSAIVAAGYDSAPVLAAAWRGFADLDIRDLAGQVRCPVLAAWARHDRVVPLAASRPALERVADLTLSVFDAGHSPHVENPAEFEAVLRTFLKRL